VHGRDRDVTNEIPKGMGGATRSTPARSRPTALMDIPR